MRIYLYLLTLALFPARSHAQDRNNINHFIVKENLIKNGKLAIIATDANENPLDSISGTYQFVINGFEQTLKFNDGVAITPHAIETSAFVFIKHRNQQGSNGRLYYVLKNDNGLNPIVINWYYLILIPAIILLIAYLFKRLMILAVVILVGLFIFNYSKGLNLENLFETLVHGIKGWY
ncbi:hypothetical protein GCM10011386_27670 [Parapedobacter defluvii]|uniref:Uncharacterized protein n=1 Tax=Parapedobacter defluvii TaxID=2045106 RepID=A0ABQ1M3F5_9SPHI|nr:hypothetical protein [Parapedobacter defluvii]RQP17432.1 MAG: hypothetical protein EAS52_08780 [Parapedobacter sp.]GGC34059.1 hypothetical protein GCM10011386_27670 [Parapedobacter defluvii]